MSTARTPAQPLGGWVLLLALIIGAQPIATDLYLPAMQDLAGSLDAATVFGFTLGSTSTLTFFTLFYGLGQVAGGEWADRFGRRPTLVAALAIYTLCGLGAIFAPTMAYLLVLRSIQGLATATIVVTARAAIRDRYSVADAPRVMSQIFTKLGIVVVLCPVVGALLATHGGWRVALAAAALYGAYILVFDTAVKNPYHFPPRWLNEGVAEYQSQGYDAGYKATIEQGARAGTLIPLDGLTGQFPTSYERFSLAYAESTAAVDFLVRTYGQDALVALINSYAKGLTDDEAFTQALGLDATAFGDAWFASVGAVAPTKYGPQPAAPGPVPAPWVGNPAPGTTAAPGAPTAAPSGSSGNGSSQPADSSTGTVALVLVAAMTSLAVLGLYGHRRRQDAADT